MSQIPNENEKIVRLRPVILSNLSHRMKCQISRKESQFESSDSDLTLGTGSTRNYDNELKVQKLMIEALQANIQTLQKALENLELKAKIRTLEENAEQNAKYQALETKFTQMLSTQSEQHQQEMERFVKEMAQLEAKNRKLEEKLERNVEVQTTKNGTFDAKMEQLQDEFAKMLVEQQKQMMSQFQAQYHSLEQKLKEAEQRAQMGKNELGEIIRENKQKMEKFRKEMDKDGQQAIGNNQQKLDYMWSQLMSKGKILANPNGITWDGSKSEAGISGLKATSSGWGFAVATEGYVISGEHCRKENFQFPSANVYYYEVTTTSGFRFSSVGFTDGSKPAAGCVGDSPNCYGIEAYDATIDYLWLWLSGKRHNLECPTGVIARGDVFGCGLLLNSKNELAVFFTVDGILWGKQIRINPTADRLYPTVYICCVSLEANFGDNLAAKPFKFDTDKCPGLVFE